MKIHPEVQALIASTNGKHYLDKVGQLTNYPEYKLPVNKAKANSIMLDIGSGWGRWLVAGANKGYIPIGIDIHHHFCETCRFVLNEHGKVGYLVNADLEFLPFKPGVFDLIWSFSVIQHTHKKKFLGCIGSIAKLLHKDGFTKLEFPNKNGLHNRKYLQDSDKKKDNYDSLCVRYYSVEEYKSFFNEFFDSVNVDNHSFLGIGILPDDLKYVTFKNKIIVFISLFFSFFAKIFPQLINLSDSVYISAISQREKNIDAVSAFLKLHDANPSENLNIVPLLQCPISGEDLLLSSDQKHLIAGNISYPVKNGIPILIPGEATIKPVESF